MTWLINFACLLFFACQLIAAAWLSNQFDWREAVKMFAWALPACALLACLA